MDVGRILIVEDDKDFADDLLVTWKPGAPVSRAASGKEAVQAITRDRPDLILLDLTLPHHLAEVDSEEGFSLLAYIRRELRRDTPVVVITADASRQSRERAIALGADALLTKPLKVADLEEIIRQSVERRNR